MTITLYNLAHRVIMDKKLMEAQPEKKDELTRKLEKDKNLLVECVLSHAQKKQLLDKFVAFTLQSE